MGITIHYRGEIEPARVGLLVDELRLLADHHGWGYLVLEDGHIAHQVQPVCQECQEGDEELPAAVDIRANAPLSGIVLTIDPRCEPLSFLFDPRGRLLDLIGWRLLSEGRLEEQELWVHTKTHFARPEVHVVVAELLRHVGERHLSRLEVSDEGEYYDTGDRDRLLRLRENINDWLDRILDALADEAEAAEQTPGDWTPERLAERIEGILRQLRGMDRR